MSKQLRIFKINKNLCDVFYGIDCWYSSEWVRFKKNNKGIWEIFTGPIHYKWFDKIENETKIIRSQRPKGSVLRACYQLIKDSLLDIHKSELYSAAIDSTVAENT